MLTALSNWVKAVRGGERRIDAGREWLVGLLAVVALAFTVVMWLQGKAGRTLAQGANKSAQQSNRLAVYQLCMNNQSLPLDQAYCDAIHKSSSLDQIMPLREWVSATSSASYKLVRRTIVPFASQTKSILAGNGKKLLECVAWSLVIALYMFYGGVPRISITGRQLIKSSILFYSITFGLFLEHPFDMERICIIVLMRPLLSFQSRHEAKQCTTMIFALCLLVGSESVHAAMGWKRPADVASGICVFFTLITPLWQRTWTPSSSLLWNTMETCGLLYLLMTTIWDVYSWNPKVGWAKPLDVAVGVYMSLSSVTLLSISMCHNYKTRPLSSWLYGAIQFCALLYFLITSKGSVNLYPLAGPRNHLHRDTVVASTKGNTLHWGVIATHIASAALLCAENVLEWRIFNVRYIKETIGQWWLSLSMTHWAAQRP